MIIFTYGTLKKGYYNNFLLRNQRLITTAKTEPVYKLYHNGSFPCMVETEDGDSIEGELWEVDTYCLTHLDALEGVPILYCRMALHIQGHENVQGYLYQLSTRGLTPCGTCWPPK